MRPAENSSFHPCDPMKEPNLERGVAKSGVNGPFIVGSMSARFCSISKATSKLERKKGDDEYTQYQ